MTPEEKERITRLAAQIQTESDTATLLNLMEELNELLGDADARTALLRAGKTTS